MPKRTNERQQIIELLKSMLAGPSSTVTPSKMLRDAVSGVEREVDVVAEHPVDGDTFVRSFEVTSKSRPADLPWAEQLIKKHEHLSTDRLYLVSWSGFTEAVVQLAQLNPAVRLVTPTVVVGRDGPEVKTLYVDTVQLATRKVVCLVRDPDGEKLRVVVETDHQVFSAEKTQIGVVQELVNSLLHGGTAVERLLRDVHNHPEREDLKWFTLGVEYTGLPIYLHHVDTDELHEIVGLEVSGEIVFSQQPLDLEVRDFEAQRFAHGRADVLGNHGLLVAALDEAFEITKITTTYPTFSAPRPEE